MIRDAIVQWLDDNGCKLEGGFYRKKGNRSVVMEKHNVVIWDLASGETVGTVRFGDPDLFKKIDELLIEKL